MAAVLLSFSCRKLDYEEEAVPASPPLNLSEITFPNDFDFKTERELEINISGLATDAVVAIYAVYDDEPENLITKGKEINNEFSKTIIIPAFCKRIKAVKAENGYSSTRFYNISNGVLNTQFKTAYSGGNKASCSELLYAVNGQSGFYTIDNETGTYDETALASLVGGGSIACAVDRTSRLCYYNTGTTLRYYDIDNQTFHVAQSGNPFNSSYPRMEYNNTDGNLYIAKNEIMHVIDPLTNNVVGSYSIVGLQSPVGGGDVAISLDGTIYMCCFSGLYRIEIVGSNANATRISAEGLPFQPTSMAIDRNDRLYLATNDANSQLIEMDKVDGSWAIVKVYSHKINDLGSLPCSLADLPIDDADNDGIIDVMDDYPNDATKAFDTYTPSPYGYGSLGFEDMWPSKGDYDLNDMVVDYRFTAVSNNNNEIVKIDAKFVLKAVGASHHNGFGFEMPFSPSLITSVTGSQLLNGVITTSANGTEAGQTNAVIMVFDDTYNHLFPTNKFVNTEVLDIYMTPDTFDIEIVFNSPIPAATIGTAPFNPFIFINQTRTKEVHLINHKPTDLATNAFFGTEDDISSPASGVYYKSSNNMPYAINIIHEFRYPKERVAVNTAYNFFVNWGLSSGASYSDWYKDNSGYRNANKIYGY